MTTAIKPETDEADRKWEQGRAPRLGPPLAPAGAIIIIIIILIVTITITIIITIIIIISLVSRWYYAHGCGLVPASGELGFSIAKRLGLLSSIDNWDVGDDQAHR